MPAIKKRPFEDEDAEFSNIIKGQIKRQSIGTQEALGRRVGTCKATTTKKVNNPETLTVEELRLYVKHLNITPQEITALIYGKEKSTQATGANFKVFIS